MNPPSPWTPPTTSALNSIGADEPSKKLQRALKAEIDEDAWSSLYTTVRRTFEVLKVYGTPPS